MHTDLALEAIDFNSKGESRIRRKPELNSSINLVTCEFFNTNIIALNQSVKKEYYNIDSFVVYICIDGEFLIRWDDKHERIIKGETVLLPAMIKDVILEPFGEVHLLETYINPE